MTPRTQHPLELFLLISASETVCKTQYCENGNGKHPDALILAYKNYIICFMANLEAHPRHNKSQTELAKQVKEVSQILGEPIAQTSSFPEVLSLTPTQLQDQFPTRYRIYERTLTELRSGESPPSHDADIKILHALNSLDRYIKEHYQNEDRRTLRDNQMTVFEDMRDFLEKDGTEGYIKLPTGTGKTVLFIKLLEATGLKTLILTPTQILVDQTTDRMREFAQSVEVGKVYAHKKEYGRPVTISTYSSAVTGLRDGRLKADDYDLIILDEAHNSLSELRTDMVKKFPHATKIGFTATPYYYMDKQVKKLLPTEIHTMNVKEAVEEELLSPFSVIVAETDVDLTNVPVTFKHEFAARELEATVNIVKRNEAAVLLYQQMFPEETAIAYCAGIKHAEVLAKLFNDHGIPAAAVSGDQPHGQRKKILRAYHEGKIKVLCNAKLLTQGFDEPRVSVCLNLRPTLSPVEAEQRGGRVLRLDPNNRLKFACVIDFIDPTSHTKYTPISFAEVVGDAFVSNRKPDRKTLGIDMDLSVKTPRSSGKSLLEIPGIKVTVNPEEVMRIIAKKTTVPQQEEELIFSTNTVQSLFHGRNDTLRLASAEVLAEIQSERPESVVKRIVNFPSGLSKRATVITDRQLFIAKMIARGYKLKQPMERGAIAVLQDTEFGLSYGHFLDNFQGSVDKIRKTAKEVVKEIKAERPDLIQRRMSGNHIIDAVCDRELFINKMIAKGLKPKNRDPNLEPIHDGELPITVVSMGKIFAGNPSHNARLAHKVADEIEKANPGFSFLRKSGAETVQTIKDIDLLIQEMQKRGISIKSRDLPMVEPSDFVLGTEAYNTYFIGGSKKVKPVADKIIKKLRQGQPDAIIRKKTGTLTVEVITDKDEFLTLMKKEGLILRRDVSQTKKLDDSEFPIYYSALYNTFRGAYSTIAPVVKHVIEQLKETQPDLIVTRRIGSKLITAVTDKELFFRLMQEHGVVRQSEQINKKIY